MRPCDAKNTDEVCALQRDNFDSSDFWILTDGYQVSIADQKRGAPPAQHINIPRPIFNRLVAWYMREQKEIKR